MANGDSGGILSQIGSGISKVLPYALPAAMGAALGGPFGAMAGMAAATPDAEQQMKRQELGLEMRKEAMGEIEMAMQIQSQQRELQAQQALSQDPDFRAHIEQTLGVSPDHLGDFLNLAPEQQRSFMESMTKLKTSGMKLGPAEQKPDGSWVARNLLSGEWMPAYEPSNVAASREATKRTELTQAAATGRTEATQAGQTSRAAENRVEKAYDDFVKNNKPPKLGILETKAHWRNRGVDAIAAAGMPRDIAERRMSAEVGIPPRTSTGDGASPPPKPPKSMWGKKGVVGPDGRKWDIDAFGKPTPAS